MKTYAHPTKTTQMLQDLAQATPRIGDLARKMLDRIAAATFALLGYEEGRDEKCRKILPMSSGSNVLPNTSIQVAARSQSMTFLPERIVIGGRPDHWIVNDIKAGNRSQFSQSGDVPGEMFLFSAVDSPVSCEIVYNAMDFAMIVTYVGPKEEGEEFTCGVIGTVTR